MVTALKPLEPVYCLYFRHLERGARRFLEGFPGRVLYAVKANNNPNAMRALYRAGVRHFDTASIPEIEQVKGLFPDAICYFMAPVRLRGAAEQAYHQYGVRHMVVDHQEELARVIRETGGSDLTVFVRMGTSNEDATYDLSTKFGASHEETIDLLKGVADAGAEPALAFNVGSLVMKTAAYERALQACGEVLERAGVDIGFLDVGGGYPLPYRGMEVPSLEEFFAAIAHARGALNLPAETELLAEPGRALVAEGVSLVTQTLLRKGQSLYLNDGVWGSFIEPVISHGLVEFPSRVYRDGDVVNDELEPFTIFGPTCDSLDRLPKPFRLPRSIRSGDWIEFGMMGAYTLTNRTGFNGFYPDTFVEIDEGSPPG
jgi:ornithine decarboxylase